ncbi:MAG: pyridoxamine 5'-phosphate oxidase family protein [Desulfarculus sp.]|nr:MAG: pyridoxamine 5'-phosphate oxidase family protein [Desulfarculus sp.]
MIQMRKPQKQLQQPAELEDILQRGEVLRLALCREDQPYLVPLNYVYHAGRIYMHTGHEGYKHWFLAANPRACFEVTVDAAAVPAPLPCKWDYRYRSVIGFGRVSVVQEEAERQEGLAALVGRFAGPGAPEMTAEALARACVLRLDIESMTGKANCI